MLRVYDINHHTTRPGRNNNIIIIIADIENTNTNMRGQLTVTLILDLILTLIKREVGVKFPLQGVNRCTLHNCIFDAQIGHTRCLNNISVHATTGYFINFSDSV